MRAPIEAVSGRRRFTLGDALILMAACALTVSVLRSGGWFARFPARVSFWASAVDGLIGNSPWLYPNLSRRAVSRLVFAEVVDEVFVELLGSLLLGLTLVQPLIRLRSPRPAWSQLLRQPGFTACMSVIVVSLIFIDLSWMRTSGDALRFAPAAATLLLWPLLGLPPWRLEPSWIDRLGRAIGWGWIAATASATVLGCL